MLKPDLHMKKIILFCVAALMALAANAQVYIGGQVGFTANSDNKTNALTILPEVGYNFNEHWSVGGTIGLVSTKVGDHSVSRFAFGPYARYTFLEMGPVRLFCDGGFAFLSGDGDSVWSVGLYPGIALPVSDKFSFVAHIGELSYTSDTTFNLGVNANNVTAGLYYSF